MGNSFFFKFNLFKIPSRFWLNFSYTLYLWVRAAEGEKQGLACSSVVECFVHMYETLSIAKKKKNRKENIFPFLNHIKCINGGSCL